MSDPKIPGFPGGHVPIVGKIVGDGEVRPLAEPQTSNRMFTPEESKAVFGEHPWKDWRYKPSKRWPPSREDLEEERRQIEAAEAAGWDASKGPWLGSATN